MSPKRKYKFYLTKFLYIPDNNSRSANKPLLKSVRSLTKVTRELSHKSEIKKSYFRFPLRIRWLSHFVYAFCANCLCPNYLLYLPLPIFFTIIYLPIVPIKLKTTIIIAVELPFCFVHQDLVNMCERSLVLVSFYEQLLGRQNNFFFSYLINKRSRNNYPEIDLSKTFYFLLHRTIKKNWKQF